MGYEIGIGEVCPTDCTLYIKDLETSKVKELLIDSESWKKVRGLKDKKGGMFADKVIIREGTSFYNEAKEVFENSVNERKEQKEIIRKFEEEKENKR